MREIALLENLQRENLTSIELAWAYKGIIDSLHIRQEDLAAKIGKSRSHVTNTLGLLNLPNDDSRYGTWEISCSRGLLEYLVRWKDEDKVEELANKVVKDNISVRDLEDISSKSNISKRVQVNRLPKTENQYKYIENELRDILGTKVRVENKKIEIFFESSVDLTRILDILNVNVD